MKERDLRARRLDTSDAGMNQRRLLVARTNGRRVPGRRTPSVSTLLLFNAPIRRDNRFRDLPNPGQKLLDLLAALLKIDGRRDPKVTE